MRRHHTEDFVTTFGILEAVADLHNVRLVIPSAEWHSYKQAWTYPVPRSTSYGDWNEVNDHTPLNPNEVYVMPDYASGSDYSGNLVEKSNHKALLEMMPSGYEDGFEYLDLSGGHGTFGLAIRLDSLTADILETLEALEDYPLIDESLHSEMEFEAQNEAWESWAKSEFKTELGKYLASAFQASNRAEQLDDETLEAAIEWLEDGADIQDGSLAELFYKMTDFANVYWNNEQGESCYIDIEEIFKTFARPNFLNNSEWKRNAYDEIKALLRSAMGDSKYDFNVVRYIDPNQLWFAFDGSTEVN